MEYRETMRAKQSPDVYAGPDFDQHLPQWVGSADGDKDGDAGADGVRDYRLGVKVGEMIALAIERVDEVQEECSTEYA